jgi:hypothetical protein
VIKVYDAADVTEAHIVRGLLLAHGIEAYVGGYYLQGGVGELAVQGFCSVLVAEGEAAAARALVESYQRGELCS